MKKKIALLLAAVMTLAAPMSAFALDRSPKPTQVIDVPKGTLAVDQRFFNTALRTTGAAGVTLRDQNIDNIFSEDNEAGFTLESAKNEYAVTNSTATFKLNNAEMYYAGATDGYISIGGSNRTYEYNPSNIKAQGYFTNESENGYYVTATNNKVKKYNDLYYTQIQGTNSAGFYYVDSTGVTTPVTTTLTAAQALTAQSSDAQYLVLTGGATSAVVYLPKTGVTVGAGTDATLDDSNAGYKMYTIANGEVLELPLSYVITLGTNAEKFAISRTSINAYTNPATYFHLGYNFTPSFDIATGNSTATMNMKVMAGTSASNLSSTVTLTGTTTPTYTLTTGTLFTPNTAPEIAGNAAGLTSLVVPTTNTLTTAAISTLTSTAATLDEAITLPTTTIAAPTATATVAYQGDVIVPLAYVTTKSDAEVNSTFVIDNTFRGVTQGATVNSDPNYTKATGTSGTKLYVTETPNARYGTNLEAVVVQELNAGVIRPGVFALQLNSSFVFEDNNLAITTSENWANVSFLGYNASRTTAYFQVNSVSASSTSGKKIEITGLSVNYTGDKYYSDHMTATLTSYTVADSQKITFYNPSDYSRAVNQTVVGDAKISNYSVNVAVFDNYGYDWRFFDTTKTAPKLWAGRINQETPKTFFGERATDSLWSARDLRFTLTDEKGVMLDGVKIAKVVISDFSGLSYRGAYEFSLDDQIGTTAYSEFNRSYIQVETMRDQTKTGKASLAATFFLNLSSNFVGDVYVLPTGTAVDPNIEVKPLKIATVAAPVKITTKNTPVAIGYQTYKTADVTIDEEAAGILGDGKVFALTIDEFADTANTNTSDITFNPIDASNVKMEDGNTLAFNRISLGANKISFAISKPSTKSNPATFTVSGLSVKINRSVPTGGYDLIAGGSAIAYSYADLKDYEKSAFFPIKGVVSQDYITVATAGDTKSVAKNVILTPGQEKAVVDNTEAKITPAPFIDTASGRILIPLRAVSHLFDIPDTNIQWDPETGIATIIISSQVGQKVVTFANDSSTMTIDGAPITMVDENNVKVKAQITEDTNRMFIPLRQLGIAYGINVYWDGTNAYFNPTTAQMPVETAK